MIDKYYEIEIKANRKDGDNKILYNSTILVNGNLEKSYIDTVTDKIYTDINKAFENQYSSHYKIYVSDPLIVERDIPDEDDIEYDPDGIHSFNMPEFNGFADLVVTLILDSAYNDYVKFYMNDIPANSDFKKEVENTLDIINIFDITISRKGSGKIVFSYNIFTDNNYGDDYLNHTRDALFSTITQDISFSNCQDLYSVYIILTRGHISDISTDCYEIIHGENINELDKRIDVVRRMAISSLYEDYKKYIDEINGINSKDRIDNSIHDEEKCSCEELKSLRNENERLKAVILKLLYSHFDC